LFRETYALVHPFAHGKISDHNYGYQEKLREAPAVALPNQLGPGAFFKRLVPKLCRNCHDRIRQIVPCRVLVGISVRLPCFRSWPAIKTRREELLLLASYVYRGHIISIEVNQNPDTLYWEASGVIELIEKGMSYTFSVALTA